MPDRKNIKDLVTQGCIQWFRNSKNEPLLSSELYAKLLQGGKYGKFLTYNRFCAFINNRIFESIGHERGGKRIHIHPKIFMMNNNQIFSLTKPRKGDIINRNFETKYHSGE